MSRRLLFPIFSCLISLCVPAHADLQFWVSVGSFTKQEGATRGMREAAPKLGIDLSVIGTDTPNGYYYRIASGPYGSRAEAEQYVRQAREAGFSGAWMWADEDTLFERGTVARSSSLDTENYQFENIDVLSDERLDELLDIEADYEISTDPLPEDYLEPDTVPELVEEPPAGYKLNKLRRDASVWPPPRTAVPISPLSQPFVQPDTQTPSSASLPPSQLLLDINANNPITLPKFDEKTTPLTIDGHLDERVWRELPGVNSFVTVDPDTGDTPRFETVVRMFYTSRGLYASFEMEQPVDSLVTWYSGRDEGRLNRDNVGITLDTSGEGRYGYWFNLALGGNQVDGTVLPERQFSGDWDGAWFGATQVTDKGWNAEILVPWSQVAMPRETGERKLNAYVSRKVAHLDERWAVPALPFTQPLFMSALQPLVLDEVDPRQQWAVFPYTSVTQDEVEAFTQSKVGADVFWRPSTNFQMTATLNPDFGNVESDEVIVNLGAFETFFPEKRLFFQEGTEVFDATPRANDRGNPTTALNTRRIGGRPRPPDVPDDVTVPSRELGQPTELVGAVKMVGQIGKTRYGLLAAQEDDVKFDVGSLNYHQEGSDYAVARVLYEDKTDDGAYRALGGISTLAAHTLEDAEVQGLDVHYQTPSGKVKLDGQMLRSDLGASGVGYGGFVDLGYTIRKGLNIKTGLSHYDDTLDLNNLGFLRRNDATSLRTDIEYTRSDLPWARKVSTSTFGDYEINGDGEKTRKGVGTRVRLDLNNQDSLRFSLSYFPRRAEDRDSRGNGTFNIDARHSAGIEYRTDSSRRLSYTVGFNRDGESLGGSRLSGRAGFVWRPVDQINIGATAEYRRRDGWLLWQGDRDFTTFDTYEWSPRLNLDYFISAKQQLRFAAQWVGIKATESDFYLVPDRVGSLIQVPKPDLEPDDFAISRVNLQLRYRWEIAPLSELFVVYTLNGDDDQVGASFVDLFEDALADPIGEQLVVKLRYRLGT